MSRLIDADRFKSFLQALCKAGAPYHEVIQLLDKQPTAYDVEKVVEQLEEIRSEYEVYSENAPDEELRAYRKGVMRGYEYSQDIVKRGGVE